MQNPFSLDLSVFLFDQNAFLVSLQLVNGAEKSISEGQKFVLVMNAKCSLRGGVGRQFPRIV